jgi:aspartyl-tRNA(Asn)/glutamyl-tRNA(Gln) amidotransferase subunit A
VSLDISSASQIAASVARGEITARAAVEESIARAHANAHLNTFLHMDEAGALATADALDSLTPAEKATKPLLGVPIAIKDNICVKGMPCTAGSKILTGYYPPYDATCVAKLRDAGAVIIGKTNLDEFGMGSSGEHSAYGPTLNPLDNSRVPGGSSSGSAAAVAAGIVPLALGSDTGGSVRLPAAFCGIFGLKATYGRISRYGLIAYASSLDHIALFARDVADLSLLLSVCAGHDRHDMTSLSDPIPTIPSVTEPNQIKVGIWQECLGEGIAPEIAAALERAQQALGNAGYKLVPVSLPLTKQALAAYYVVATAEASSNLARYDGVLYGARHTGDNSMLEMYRRTRGEFFGTEVKRRILLGTFVLSVGYHDKYYDTAMKLANGLGQQLDDAFGKVDVIAGLTSPTAAFKLGEIVNPLQMYLTDVFTCPPNLVGIPAMTVPVWLENGLSAGLQLMAKRGDEGRLLEMASVLSSLIR